MAGTAPPCDWRPPACAGAVRRGVGWDLSLAMEPLKLNVERLRSGRSSSADPARSATRSAFVVRNLPAVQKALENAINMVIVAKPPSDDPVREVGRHLLTGAATSTEGGAEVDHAAHAAFFRLWRSALESEVQSQLEQTFEEEPDDPSRGLGYRLFVGLTREIPHAWVKTSRETPALTSLPTGLRLLETLRRDSMWSMPTASRVSRADALPSGHRGVTTTFLRQARRFFEVHRLLDVPLEEAARGSSSHSIISMTTASGLSLVEALVQAARRENVPASEMSELFGPADAFCSHAWGGSTLRGLLDAMDLVASDLPVPRSRTREPELSPQAPSMPPMPPLPITPGRLLSPLSPVGAPAASRPASDREPSGSSDRSRPPPSARLWLDVFALDQRLTLDVDPPARADDGPLAGGPSASGRRSEEAEVSSLLDHAISSASAVVLHAAPLLGTWSAPPHAPLIVEADEPFPPLRAGIGPTSTSRAWCLVEVHHARTTAPRHGTSHSGRSILDTGHWVSAAPLLLPLRLSPGRASLPPLPRRCRRRCCSRRSSTWPSVHVTAQNCPRCSIADSMNWSSHTMRWTTSSSRPRCEY